jgi:hypothetical protein
MSNIRPATVADLPAIMPLYESARRFMRLRGNKAQWVNGYPSKEAIARDIELGHCFVGTDADGRLRFVFAFIIGDDPTYRTIEGQWLNDRPYGTIHRLASSGEAPGAFRSCVDYCLTLIDNIRVDTHADNAPMRSCIAREGFTHCGVIYVADGTPREAYQLCASAASGRVKSETSCNVCSQRFPS